MRNPGDMPQQPVAATPLRFSRRRIWTIALIAAVVVVLFSLRALALLYTDRLWFGSVHLSSVWSSLFRVKAGLVLSFAAIFFVLAWVNLYVADRVAPWSRILGSEDELVRRYQAVIAPKAVWVRTIVALALALLLGVGTISQWQNWILFTHAVSFHRVDPLFHKDIGFFVFRLPFLSFLTSWSFVAVFVVFILTAIAHYLNGGIRLQRQSPRVSSAAKAHLSLLLALLALTKAFGYIVQRYTLDTSTQGYVQGAGYTAVHAQLPAFNLLFWISLAACAILVVNIWRRGWVLPVLSVGLWAFVALVIGTIYPAIVQRFHVSPAQATLEQPYIARNITATREALGINTIKIHRFSDTSNLTPAAELAAQPELSNVQLWDPNLTQPTFQKLQGLRTYYQFNTLAVDRYRVNGVETPVVIGLRQVNSSSLPAESWVNSHLQYTHGYGAVVAPSNQADPNGNPVFDVGELPPSSTNGLPQLSQPSVYFGIGNPQTDVSYVIANSRQLEIDYQRQDGSNVESHYTGNGGVQLNSFITRAAFALRFGDLNLLISNQIDSKSRLMYIRDIRQGVLTAAPFLQLDSDPYPVILHGGLYWVQDAYTATSNYPYAQAIDPTVLPQGSGIASNDNYIRNSVKVLVNAYTGQMTFYVMDPHDPIIQSYERAFPGMFTPASHMSAVLRRHLRYPEDLFAVQAQMFGRYHITNAQAFYSAGDAWTLSQSPGTGSPTAATQTTQATNAQGIPVGPAQVQKMSPIYQEITAPGGTGPSYTLMDAYVPTSNTGSTQTLSGFLIAGCDPSNYGQLTAYQTTQGQSFVGPALVDSIISQNATVSKNITLLNQNGSNVLLGQVYMIPIGQAMIYVRPLYVASSRNPLPELKDVIVVYGNQAAMEPTLQAALTDVFTGSSGGSSSTLPSSPATGGTVPQQVQNLLGQAAAAYQKAQTDLKAGNLGAYQADVTLMGQLLAQAQAAAQASVPTGTASVPSNAGSTPSSTKGSPSAKTKPTPTTTTVSPNAA